jgi:hypothetical protein
MQMRCARPRPPTMIKVLKTPRLLSEAISHRGTISVAIEAQLKRGPPRRPYHLSPSHRLPHFLQDSYVQYDDDVNGCAHN